MVHVFDITKVTLTVAKVNTDGTAGESLGAVDNLGTDGFGFSPAGENTLIEGLLGPKGFNIDPSTATEITVTLKSSSSFNKKFYDAWKDKTMLKFTIASDDPDMSGWESVVLSFVMVVKPAEFATSEKEMPDREWSFTGYGYEEVYP